MKQHLGRQSGVQKVDVSLLDGKVDIVPKEDGQIDPAGLLKATYDSGVSVAEMGMTARGKIVKDALGNLGLQVAPNCFFALVPNRNPSYGSRPTLQKAGKEEESEGFAASEAADSGSAEEGIDAEEIPVSRFCCRWSRRM